MKVTPKASHYSCVSARHLVLTALGSHNRASAQKMTKAVQVRLGKLIQMHLFSIHLVFTYHRKDMVFVSSFSVKLKQWWASSRALGGRYLVNQKYVFIAFIHVQ